MIEWIVGLLQNDVLVLVLLTLLPFLELRASIPYGILSTDINWISVFIICTSVNIILAPLLWVFVNYVMHLFLRVEWIDKMYQRIVVRTQKKVHPYVEKYGTIGLAVFIGIPLPGSGLYTGALGAYLLGFKFKDYLIAAVIGVLIAGTVVTGVVMFGSDIMLRVFVKV